MLSILNNNLHFSPLEQFDNASWVLGNTVYDVVFNLSQSILETERLLGEYFPILNEAGSKTPVLFAWFVWFVITVLIHRVDLLFSIWFLTDLKSKNMLPKKPILAIEDFSFTALYAGIHLLTGFVFIVWFDFIKTVQFEDFNKVFYNIPQINTAFILDESLITFIVAFLFLSGSESEDEENFLLERRETDFTGDFVASLILANIGSRFGITGPIFVKISTIFGFVFFNNLIGMVPYSDTATSSLILTFWVALGVMVSIVHFIIRKYNLKYFLSFFVPSGAPLPLLIILVPIEIVSYSFRVVSLAVRLFANMMAGHTLFKVLVGFSWTMILLGDLFLIVNLFPLIILFVLSFLELAIAAVQAYIFSVLICMYLSDLFVSNH